MAVVYGDYLSPAFIAMAHRGGSLLTANLGIENTVRAFANAVELGFTYPGTGEWVVFESGYPEDLAHALRRVADPAD